MKEKNTNGRGLRKNTKNNKKGKERKNTNGKGMTKNIEITTKNRITIKGIPQKLKGNKEEIKTYTENGNRQIIK